MTPTEGAVKDVQKRIEQHQLAIVCRALMWEGIVAGLSVERAGEVLDSLPPEDQRYLRDVYAEWPPSLRAQREELHPVCAAVETWCNRLSDP